MSAEDDLQAQLIAEQIRHILDVHAVKLEAVQKDNSRLEKISEDHEQRLRSVTEAATQFRTLPGLLSGLALIISIVAGLIALFGR